MGESKAVGLGAVLLRLSGCNLACSYCDTLHSRTETGHSMSVTHVVQEVVKQGLPRVLITGGEPMLQPHATAALAQAFLDRNMAVYLETNGSISLAGLPDELIRVVDVKTPGSGFGDSFLSGNLSLLRPHDELKFVISSREDYLWSVEFLTQHSPLGIPNENVLFSPCAPTVKPVELAEWIMHDRLDVRFHIQMHKFVWGDARGV